MLEGGSGIIDDLVKVKDLSSFGLLVLGVVCTFRWIPKWIAMLATRHDAIVTRYEKSLDDANARHTTMISAWREEQAEERKACDGRAERILTAVTEQHRELRDQIAGLGCSHARQEQRL